MSRSTRVLIAALCLLLALPVWARQDPAVCGTYRGQVQEDLYRHRRNLALRARIGGVTRSDGSGGAVVRGPVYTTRPDAGDVAIVEASDGVVATPNTFDLDQRTVTFTPAAANASSYRVSNGPGSYDSAAATGGNKIGQFGDDDTRLLQLPFRFPFFGQQYDSVYINSDGNLTFGAADISSSERSLGRFNSGPPRIAGMFDDLDPSASADGVKIFTTSAGVVISWVKVPEWTSTGPSGAHTFQIRLYPDGKIEFAWSGATPVSAVVGISPGRLTGDMNVIDLTAANSNTYSGSLSERFGNTSELDFVTIAQKFYATHDDAYDYLIVFNGLAMNDGQTSLASTRPIRVPFSGNGDTQVDFGKDFGSPSRLQALIHMAYPGQYPDDLTTKLFNLGRPTDSSITVLAHEIGHLWLAYASVPDPNGNADYQPMLGYGASHWSFNFNSEASLLEGNAIQDLGSNRFTTVRATEVYSPLDQYLMGLRAPEDVPATHPMFYVANATDTQGRAIPNTRHPALSVSITGQRADVDINQLLTRYGRRTPDQTVSQKRFRLGFVFVVPTGSQPAATDLDKINQFRTMIEPYFNQATGNRASLETSIRRALHVSTFPGAGVLKGSTMTGKITVDAAPQSSLTVSLQAANGLTNVPSSVTIPAGATWTSFTVQGVRGGVEELVATPSDTVYETVRSNVQVLDSASDLKVIPVSGGDQIAQPNSTLLSPVVFRVIDHNNLPYPGIRVNASVRSGGQLDQTSAVTDEQGYVQFRWTTSDSSLNELKVTAEGVSTGATVYAWSRPTFEAKGVVNAASFLPDVAPGSLASIFGVNLAIAETWASSIPLPTELARVQVRVNGSPVPLLYVSPLQINFQMPAWATPGSVNIDILNAPLGSVANSVAVSVNVAQVAPAIFNDPAAGVGAIHVAGQRVKTNQYPAHVGDYVEIYATGLGSVHATSLGQETDLPVKVFVGGQQVSDVPYAGLNGTYVGLYQVNAKVPAGLAAGRYAVALEIGGKRSPEVFMQVQ